MVQVHAQNVTPQSTNSVQEEVAAPAVREQEPSEDMNEIRIESVKKTKSAASQKDLQGTKTIEAKEKREVSESESVQNAFMMSAEDARLQRTQRSPSTQRQVVMDEAVGYFEKKSPESFEFHFYKYVSGNYNTALRDHLIQAEKLRPDNSDVQLQLAALYAIEGQKDLQKEYLLKLADNGRLPKSSITYAEDVLLSANGSKYLIAHALEDALALWYQQLVGNIKNDVKVISLDLLQSDTYRNHLKKEGLVLSSKTLIDVNYLHDLLRLNQSKQFSLTMTIPKEYFVAISDKIFVHGLVFNYSESGQLKEDSNQDLWNNTLKKHLTVSATDEKGKQLSANYLPMLLIIKEKYNNEQDSTKVKEIEKVINHIVTQSRKQGIYSKVIE